MIFEIIDNMIKKQILFLRKQREVLELKKTITKIKISLEGLNRRNKSKSEYMSAEIIQFEEQKVKRMKKLKELQICSATPKTPIYIHMKIKAENFPYLL